MKDRFDIIEITLFLLIGLGIGILIGMASERNKTENSILIENQSDEWHWLDNEENTRNMINEYWVLKNILINNECSDGGFMENLDGKEFLIVCYEAKKVIREVDKE